MSANSSSNQPGKTEKDPHFKGQSRVLKQCHWCSKKEEPGIKSFQACGQCKEVIYCSKECQRASWPFHKTACQINAKAKKSGPLSESGTAKQVAAFKKWHSLHLDSLKHAIVCALNLGKDPNNLSNGIVLVQVEPKPNQKDLPPKRQFTIVGGHTFTMEEAYIMLAAQGGKPILDSCKRESEHMRKKGGIGLSPVLMMMGDVCDIVKVILPKPADATRMQKENDWGQQWALHLAYAVEQD
ncbi:hypothetical protein FA15DRAFT_100458 [Coprinopsis marcescibilis]|uniref:MYND-type domain-containing protein n=1 Tax=Coprinopsis marcescibilis TaxID=230819 RepID=A0A5C3KKT4_COPMA|nr:hypothetical protein FA15DRAFT_100458 [Coprinopsis marcescibilis]